VVIKERTTADRRAPLTRERVLQAAVELADRDGIENLSMRKLGQELGVDAMALYRHVRDKDDLLDGAVEVVVGEIERPEPGDDWKATLRELIMAARGVMLRHPWAPRVLEERGTAGPAALAHINAVLGTLLAGGFSMDTAHHALHSLSSRIFGFHQDLFDDSGRAPDPETQAMIVRSLSVSYPSLAELAAAASHDGGLGACDDAVEFAFGLDLILDGLERVRVPS
jgi:AcrR family transcriptional regulator